MLELFFSLKYRSLTRWSHRMTFDPSARRETGRRTTPGTGQADAVGVAMRKRPPLASGMRQAGYPVHDQQAIAC
jgi:hypothetical protein